MSDSNDFGYFLAYENVVIEAHFTFTFSMGRVRDPHAMPADAHACITIYLHADTTMCIIVYF